MKASRQKILSTIMAAALLLSACAGSKAVDPADGKVQMEEAQEQKTEAEEQTMQEQKPEAEEQTVQEQKPEAQEQTAQEQKTEKEEQPAGAKESNPAQENEKTQIVIPEIAVEAKEVPASDAMEFVKNMKVGWNLGNTLDANNGVNPGNELLTETCWGNPKTTQEMLAAVKDAGFNTVRIPVTWYNHVQKKEDGSYEVSTEWLDRVQEVVDYAYDGGMYVILNTHHDVALDYGYYPDEAHYEQSAQFLKSIWSAVAERFKDYDEHLIMESLNEPRLAGSGYEWNFSDSVADCQDSAECINRLNQLFVDTVRAGGENNAKRYLMVPGYAASPAGALTDLFVLPTDSAQGKLILSTHAYIPYNFALKPLNESGSTDQFNIDGFASPLEINGTLDKLYEKYVFQGIPVVMGEFGARNKNDNLQDRVNYYAFYIAAARARGISCCIWDNGIFGGNGEQFGLLKRESQQWIYPDIVEAIMKYA